MVVTQPRRVAARSAARRLAELDGTKVGGRIGYTVRGESHTGTDTVIEFVTPGILLRRLLADPGLENTAAVILDEVHERGLETDLLLGMLTEVRQLRPDLKLVAMSATVDAPRFAALIANDDDGGGPVPVIGCPSALYPLEVRWAPGKSLRIDEHGVTRSFLNHIAETAAAAHGDMLTENPQADALVFVPGAWEVSYVASQIRNRVAAGPPARGPETEVLELHGQVDPREQDRAVSGRRPGEPPRIIVSTSLAESSLTVPGVRLVIDSGLAREPRRDAARGMSGLVTVSCSRASACGVPDAPRARVPAGSSAVMTSVLSGLHRLTRPRRWQSRTSPPPHWSLPAGELRAAKDWRCPTPRRVPPWQMHNRCCMTLAPSMAAGPSRLLAELWPESPRIRGWRGPCWTELPSSVPELPQKLWLWCPGTFVPPALTCPACW